MSQKLENKKILLLPPELANQIAAGEVVERPASVVKELVENSLDAGASQVEVRVINGGQSLISVQDNGIGIPSDDLSLAFVRHATSKLQNLAGLSQIESYGFRGEALPSIASVSRFRAVSIYTGSKENDAYEENDSRNANGTNDEKNKIASASELSINFGKYEPIRPASLHKGTLMEVQDLFFNIPARLKFLKTPATELKRCQDLFVRLALVREGIKFSFFADTRQTHLFEANMDTIQRLAVVWPSSIIDALVPVSHENYGIKITGFVSDPRSSQPRADRMLFYVNGRAISDKILLKAVRQAYQGILTTKDYPQVLLSIEIPTQDVDVNVHPAKNEVRFRDERSIFTTVKKAVELAMQKDSRIFKAHDFGAEARPLRESVPSSTYHWGDLGKYAISNSPKTRLAEDTAEWLVSGSQDSVREIDYSNKKILDFSSNSNDIDGISDTCGATIFSDDSKQDYTVNRVGSFEKSFLDSSERILSEMLVDDSEINPENPINDFFYLGQLGNTYLILKKGTNSLVLLDQHAVHERILYEQICKGQALGQSLLLPLELSLHPAEEEELTRLGAELATLGFTLRKSAHVCVVDAMPERLDRNEAVVFLHRALGGQGEDLRLLWAHHACRAALKAGSSLDEASALNLVKQWLATEEPDYCPHGRPCAILLQVSDLEKLFKRKV